MSPWPYLPYLQKNLENKGNYSHGFYTFLTITNYIICICFIGPSIGMFLCYICLCNAVFVGRPLCNNHITYKSRAIYNLFLIYLKGLYVFILISQPLFYHILALVIYKFCPYCYFFKEIGYISIYVAHIFWIMSSKELYTSFSLIE